MLITELKQYIYNNDKTSFVLEQLGCHNIKVHPMRGYITASNPDGDNKSAVLVYNDENLSVQNFTRDLKSIDPFPDIITLVRLYKNLDFRSALKWLHSILGLKFTATYKSKTDESRDVLDIFKSTRRYKKDSIEYKILNEDLLLDFYPYIHKEFAKEGILQNTIDKFQLGYSYEARGTIIPIRYWLDGSLIGIIRRTSVENYADFDIPKYFPIKPYLKSGNVYGLWENYKDIQQKGECVVFEGQKSVLKRDTMRDNSAVAVCGHDISEEQVKILSGLNLKEIIIAFDKDVSQNEVRAQCEKFYGFRNVSYIYDTEDLLECKDSPADKGEDIYQYLLKNRIHYDANEHDKYLAHLHEQKIRRGT